MLLKIQSFMSFLDIYAYFEQLSNIPFYPTTSVKHSHEQQNVRKTHVSRNTSLKRVPPLSIQTHIGNVQNERNTVKIHPFCKSGLAQDPHTKNSSTMPISINKNPEESPEESRNGFVYRLGRYYYPVGVERDLPIIGFRLRCRRR